MRTSFAVFALVFLFMGCGNNNTASGSAVAAAPGQVKAPVPVENTGKEALSETAAAVKAIVGVQDITDAGFNEKVIRNPGLTIVDFNAAWCGPCQVLVPMFKQAAADFAGQAAFVSVDVDESPETSRQYNIQSIPLLLFFKGGKIVHRMEGLPDKALLYSSIRQYR